MLAITRIIKDPEVRRAELIDTALELFSSVGYQQTMIIDIVKKAGVAKGTFYYYFPSKEAILEAIVIRYATEVVTELDVISRNSPALHKLKLFIERLFIPDPFDTLFNKLWDEQQLDLLYKTWLQAEKVFNALLTDMIQQGNQEKTMHVDCLHETIAFLWSTLHCLWEASYLKDAPDIFNNKVKIAESVLERILKVEEGALVLTLPTPRNA